MSEKIQGILITVIISFVVTAGTAFFLMSNDAVSRFVGYGTGYTEGVKAGNEQVVTYINGQIEELGHIDFNNIKYYAQENQE